MALDIAAGRRFPVFFDGQRYMGAVEGYVAAVFVSVFGHAPEVVALAPLLGFGLFAAGQYAVWSRWADRGTGHLAAALAVVGSPMLAIWGVVPRGGYIEFLAWALPTLAGYRALARAGSRMPHPVVQAAWGFALALGYFLNPLSLTVYTAIALDWTFVRHGADLRRERGLRTTWLDGPFAPAVWFAVAAGAVLALAFFCHVDPRRVAEGSPYVALGGMSRAPWALAAGGAGVVGLIAVGAWWSGGPARLCDRLVRQPWHLAGVLLALFPFCLYAARVALHAEPAAPSLPVWITAPWKAGANVATALHALSPLVGCAPRAYETVLIGQGVEPPSPSFPWVDGVLRALSPVVTCGVVGLIFVSARRERGFWSRAFALRCEDVGTPVGLATLYLGVSLGLYLLQGSSPNDSSVRYLLPVWAVLPGLLAVGLRTLPPRLGWVIGSSIVLAWVLAQGVAVREICRPSPTRPLAEELQRRGIAAIVAPTPVALTVANLTHGAVGAIEYQPIWPRLGRRYVDRFANDHALTCVVDRGFPWAIRGEGGWSTGQDFGRHLRGLGDRHPGRVRFAWKVGPFEVWEVALPMADVLALEPD